MQGILEIRCTEGRADGEVLNDMKGDLMKKGYEEYSSIKQGRGKKLIQQKCIMNYILIMTNLCKKIHKKNRNQSDQVLMKKYK